MLVLLTGGAGFIGRHVVSELVRCGHDVRVLDSRCSVVFVSLIATAAFLVPCLWVEDRRGALGLSPTQIRNVQNSLAAPATSKTM
jgi:UDP-glucose 4-epimerase